MASVTRAEAHAFGYEVPDLELPAHGADRAGKAAYCKGARMPLHPLLFILASPLWLLPVLGIEMLPVGLLLIAQDVPFPQGPVGRLTLWLERKWVPLRRWRQHA
jgi:hypothetical protein